jgi:hypothetical protein
VILGYLLCNESSNKREIITANGIANIIQTNHITFIQTNIIIRIIKGLIHNALFIIIGTIHHSICCIITNNIPTATKPPKLYHNIPTNKAGKAPKIGPKYGINSINQAINANVHLFSKFIQNKDKVHNHI